jgi:hypothetical protein
MFVDFAPGGASYEVYLNNERVINGTFIRTEGNSYPAIKYEHCTG